MPPPLPLIEAWLRGRSLARGLPLPHVDRGGLRVDTDTPDEVARWVFDRVGPGLRALGREITGPGYPLKLFGTAEQLAAALPSGWRIDGTATFMQEGDDRIAPSPSSGYRIERERAADIVRLRIVAMDGTIAASGYAADLPEAFVYDRIATVEAHRRRGLATGLMRALRDQRRYAGTPGLLVATAAGAAVYRRLGWQVLSPYATALRKG